MASPRSSLVALLSQNIVNILNNARTLPRIEEQLGILKTQIETDVKGGSLGDTANTTSVLTASNRQRKGKDTTLALRRRTGIQVSRPLRETS
jgi:hypothetical protein